MKQIRLGLIAMAVVLSSPTIKAQTYSHGEADVISTVNFAEMAEYEAAHPIPFVIHRPFEEAERDEDQAENPEPDPSLVHMVQRPDGYRTSSATTVMPISVCPLDTFQGVLSNGSYIPPDTHGAVDTQYVVTVTNYAYRIQKRNGAFVAQLSLDGFWGSSILTHGGGSFDPRIHFDPFSKRWIFVAFAYGQTAYAQLMIAVSQTSSPTGAWNKYRVIVDATGANWLDFPNVGFNNKWIVITGNFFSNSSGNGTGAVIYTFNKSAVLAGTGAPYTKISPSGFTLCPSLTYDSTESSIFVVDIYNAGSGKLRLRKITGAVGSETLSSTIGYPTATTGWAQSAALSNYGFAPQLGTVNKLDAGDNRITNLIFRNGKLWCSHNAFLPASGPTRCAVMWWQFDSLASPVQNGLISDPTNKIFYAYPSIAVNKNDDAMIGFSYLSSTIHPCAAYAVRLHTDPLDSLQKPYVYRHGLNSYYATFGDSRNRWGDYSATCIDPKNNLDFWTSQECVPVTQNLWDTWWAQVQLCAVNTFTMSAHSMSTTSTSDTITFTGSSQLPSCATVTWNFAGGTATPGTGLGPQVVRWATGGKKVVTLTIDNGSSCNTVYSDSVQIGRAGVSEIASVAVDVNIVPNPSGGAFDVRFAQDVAESVTVKIVSIDGRELYNRQFAVKGNKLSVDNADLPAGIYIANICMGDVVITRKITVIR